MENKTITTSNGAVLTPIENSKTLNFNLDNMPPVQITVQKEEHIIIDSKDSPMYRQLKELNNKTSSQTGFEKQVYGEIKTEYQKQQKSANILSWKDWKILILGGIIGGVITIIIELMLGVF